MGAVCGAPYPICCAGAPPYAPICAGGAAYCAAGAPGIIIPAAGGAPYAAPGGVGAWGENMPTGCVDVAYADCAGEAPYESYELCAGAGGSEGAPPYDKTPPPALS